jgi:hypothetical protein
MPGVSSVGARLTDYQQGLSSMDLVCYFIYNLENPRRMW